MTGRHHIVSGAVVGLCLSASLIISGRVEIGVAGAFATTVLGSIFPDIDTSTSKLGKKMKFTSRLMNMLFGHRGFLHSPIFAVLSMILLNWLFAKYNIEQYNYIWQGFGIGILNHLMCDMMTKGGIPLLYPFYKWKFSFSNMKSGSKLEFIPLLIVCSLSIVLTILFVCGGTFL